MKKLICCLLLGCLLSNISMKAQNISYEVKGQVVDSLTFESEVYVTIRLFKLPDNQKEVTAFVSDDKGFFYSKLKSPGEYRLTITSVGKETIVKDFELNQKDFTKDFGRLLMKDDVKQLSEINVFAAKPLVKAEVDKTVYSIEDDPDSETNTILEMLRKVPFVTVDGDDNIKVNNSSSFKIYMNGKPSSMMTNNPKEVLRSIPANTIRKIEVITEPGARYDAEGVSGILNIITKGAEFEGYSANIGGTYMNRYWNGAGFFTMQYGKLSLSANYSYGQYEVESEADYYRHQLNRPDEEYLHNQYSYDQKNPMHYAALESSYELDSLNLFTLSGSLNYGYSNSEQSGSNMMTNSEGQLAYSYNQDATTKYNWGSNSLKADYQHMFKRNKEEMLTFSYQFDYRPDDRDYLSHIFDRNGNSPSLQYLYNYNYQFRNAHKEEHTLQLDYVNPFSPEHSIEGGLKYIRRNNNSYSTFEMKENEEDEWQPSELQPVLDYRHIQNIFAAYCGYTYKKNRFGLNTGLRMEQTWQNVKYRKGDGENFDYQATDWVPSLSASYKLNDHDQLKLSYNLRIRRPDISYLNPYVSVTGASMSYGNPELTSEKHNRITLSFSHFSSKLNVQATALYTLGRNEIGQYQFVDEQGMFHSTYENMVNIQGGGMNGYIGYNPAPNTSVSVNGMLYYLDLRVKKGVPDILNGLKNSGFSGSVYLNFSQRFKYGWRFVAFGGYGKPEVSIGVESFKFHYYGMSLVKTFLKDKLSISLRAQDCFTPSVKYTSKEMYNDYTSILNYRAFNRMFGLSVSYRFGDLKASIKKTARSIHNDDLLKKDDK
ncbi:outer membrane beta-barrel family protein [Parabacteroides bouchesdurhonensis]|uniref:outer membrane beta-barrel family protein n=1 Tax=Parabacteroides bouchesdurhonensis TaxID=1936995 RepID=UPI00164D630D|nr:outer membrane beta-barrel family protein [Parabacteroides bouchesdurhonensis]